MPKEKRERLVQLAGPGNPLKSPYTPLAMALATIGIPVHNEAGLQHLREEKKNGEIAEMTIWTLGECSECGKYQTEELVRAWDDEAWLKAHPEHPLTYMKKFYSNYRKGVAHAKQLGAMAVFKKGRRVGFITKDTPPALRKLIEEAMR